MRVSLPIPSRFISRTCIDTVQVREECWHNLSFTFQPRHDDVAFNRTFHQQQDGRHWVRLPAPVQPCVALTEGVIRPHRRHPYN